MPARRIRLIPADAARSGFDAVRADAELPPRFGAEAQAEAERAVRRAAGGERVEVPFVTIDPPGSRDLDQAMHIERLGDGHRVRYAIADVGAFVAPGGPLDSETHARGVTVYVPDAKVPLHPPVLSEGAASLLEGQWVPSVLWTIDLDGRGEAVTTSVRRAVVRSVGQHTYADVPPALAPLLQEVGERRLALEQARGGVRLVVPEQEVVLRDGTWTTSYRVPLPAEDWGAQVSLLTGLEAAKLMLRLGTGILRTQPAPAQEDYDRLRHQARALGVDWPASQPYPEMVRGLDPARPAHAALAQQAARLGHGAGYTAFDGAPPEAPGHFAVAAAYAHATAPLRRLQDRYVSECCLAAANDTALAGWVRSGLPALPDVMQGAARRAGKAERSALDLVEALLLEGREGETFAAVVVDDGLIQIGEPAVRAKLADGCPPPGSELQVRLTRADPAARAVTFTAA